MEQLAVQVFLDGLRDTETHQALTLARPSKLVDALARALEFEAAKQSCRGQAKVCKMEENVGQGTCNEAEIRRVVDDMWGKRQIRCWNCEDTALPERSEMILDAHLDGNPCVGNIMVFEPRSHNGEVARGIAVGKALLLTEKTVLSEEVLTDQENDPNLRPIVNWKKEGRKPTWEEVSRYSPIVKSYWAQWNTLALSDGLKTLLEKTDGTEERKQLIVPRNRVPEVLEEIHNGSTGGDLGLRKTLGKVRERFY
ncbi:hypothetical protein NQ318_020932 [Aromia moschata]|uniref:Uncharacterized protein n=1 Tax=Aromia moschata TaxID=1265417 RepID=A0AAV8XC07_9CUCU|nr:hypothetical protein NQ318_020932 [Aromia moschata]